jgi:hypothetical protein
VPPARASGAPLSTTRVRALSEGLSAAIYSPMVASVAYFAAKTQFLPHLSAVESLAALRFIHMTAGDARLRVRRSFPPADR